MKPLAIDLFCGLGGWTEGLLAEGYDVIGFDIEQHQYGDDKYPAQLVIQDVMTLHGSQFKDAALIVASPPCQAYSYRAMPWKRAKALPPPDNSLFEACFRIQNEACEAAGRHIPMVVENVRGAIPWVGRSRWNFGSFHLWGDVPALMPMTKAVAKVPGLNWSGHDKPGYIARAFNDTAVKNAGFRFDGSGRSFQTESVNPHIKVPSESGRRTDVGKGVRFTSRDCGIEAKFKVTDGGVKGFTPNGQPLGKNELGRKYGSKSKARKAASAMIAKIPLPLSRHIAKTYYRSLP